MNRFEVIGRLTRNAELKYSNSGLAVSTFAIAENTKVKGVDEVSYYDMVSFGKYAETMNPYLNKGTEIVVFGKFKQDRFEKDGVKRSKIKFLAEHVHLCGGGQNNNQAVIGDTVNQQDQVQSTPTGFAELDEDIPY